MALLRMKSAMPSPTEALPGRSMPLRVPETHFVNGHRIVPPFPAGLEEAIFAMGCFWGTEAAFEQLKGVNQVVAGYAGGDQEHASYDKYEASNHAECVKITYDPHQITYAQLLQVFFTLGQPTVKDGQQPDMGHEYRMAVFYENDDQKRVAESYVQQLTADHVFDSPIAVTVENMPHGFFPAEEYHQHYVAQHPNESYVETVSMAKVRHIRDAFKDWLRQGA